MLSWKHAAALAALVAGAACGNDTVADVDAAVATQSERQAAPAMAPRYRVVQSSFDHDETLRRLFQAIDRRDLTVFAMIDHQAGAQSVGLDMAPATAVIFGSPEIGTPLMKARPELAAELPLRAAIFEDENGNVQLAVTAIGAIGRSYELLDTEGDRIKAIRDNLSALVSEATGTDG